MSSGGLGPRAIVLAGANGAGKSTAAPSLLRDVRLHRMHGVPMALWIDEEVRCVDPWEIRLPGEVPEGEGRFPGPARDPRRRRTRGEGGRSR